LNPVVAALVHAKSASPINGCDGNDSAGLEKLRTFADQFLDIEFPSELTLTPARGILECAWLGDAVSQEQRAGGEAVYNCTHPRHTETTLEACRRCRDWARHKPISRPLSLEEVVPLPGERWGTAVRNWGVGITTAPRRISTLEDCLDSVIRAGWESPKVFFDGADRLPSRYRHLHVNSRSDSIGAWPAWYLALAELILQQPEADAYLMLQDDVIFHEREPVRDYLERALWPGRRPSVVSLFYTGFDLLTGWRSSPPLEWHWGAQGLVFPPAVARALVADADLLASCVAATTHVPIPELLSRWMATCGLSSWYPTPSLTQHIGATSTVWMNAGLVSGRRAPWFSGNIDDEPCVEQRHGDFRESAFPCPVEAEEGYRSRIDAGKARMGGASVVVCGICRNVRNFLPKMAACIERLGGLFKEHRIVMVENDSVDATVEFLRDWSGCNPRVVIESDNFAAPSYPQVRCLDRASWLAECRNRYHRIVAERFPSSDYVIVLDMDLAGGFSFDGVAHTFGHEDWDFVGAYGLVRPDPTAHGREWPYSHYDTWAFRPESSSHPAASISPALLRFERGDPLVPVSSCFGGLGIYRREAFVSAQYSGTDCEHVPFHEGLRRAGYGRQYMNPSQIVLHSPG
jgi:hypothetical protein